MRSVSEPKRTALPPNCDAHVRDLLCPLDVETGQLFDPFAGPVSLRAPNGAAIRT